MIASASLQRWNYLAVRPMNLFLWRAFSNPIRAEDFARFSPRHFNSALAEGLDAADAEFRHVLSPATNAQLSRALDAIMQRTAAADGMFRLAQSQAPSRREDMFAVLRHFVDIADAMGNNPAQATLSMVLSTLEQARNSTQRLQQTRDAAALYGAHLLEIAEVWLQLLVRDVAPVLNADFRRAGLP